MVFPLKTSEPPGIIRTTSVRKASKTYCLIKRCDSKYRHLDNRHCQADIDWLELLKQSLGIALAIITVMMCAVNQPIKLKLHITHLRNYMTAAPYAIIAMSKHDIEAVLSLDDRGETFIL